MTNASLAVDTLRQVDLYDYPTARQLLGQYEGRRATILTIEGVALVVPLVAIPPALLAISVWVAQGGIGQFAVGLLSIATGWLPSWGYKRRIWEQPVRQRLACRTAFDPAVPQVSVNIARADLDVASVALRRADLIVAHSRIRGDFDARPLDTNISIARPSRLAAVEYEATRDAVVDVFRSTRIAANVGGVEVNLT